MLQYLFDNVWVFNAGDNLHLAPTFLALFNLYGEDAFQPLGPGKPTQNAFVESFNGKFREYCLDMH